MIEFLARSHGPTEIVVADIDKRLVLEKTNNAILGAANMGFYPRIRALEMDLNDLQTTTATLAREQPDLIFNSTTLQSWWVIGQLPENMFHRILQAGLGPWIPMHLTLTHKLMQAVRESGIRTHVVNASFPDGKLRFIQGRLGSHGWNRKLRFVGASHQESRER